MNIITNNPTEIFGTTSGRFEADYGVNFTPHDLANGSISGAQMWVTHDGMLCVGEDSAYKRLGCPS